MVLCQTCLLALIVLLTTLAERMFTYNGKSWLGKKSINVIPPPFQLLSWKCHKHKTLERQLISKYVSWSKWVHSICCGVNEGVWKVVPVLTYIKSFCFKGNRMKKASVFVTEEARKSWSSDLNFISAEYGLHQLRLTKNRINIWNRLAFENRPYMNLRQNFQLLSIVGVPITVHLHHIKRHKVINTPE